MTDIKRKIIADLAADLEQKRATFEALGMRNVYGLSADERKQSAVEYALAEAEMVEAGSRLRGAIASV